MKGKSKVAFRVRSLSCPFGFLVLPFDSCVWALAPHWRKALDCPPRATLSHEYARTAYPLGDVVQLAEERYLPTWAFIELQNECESIEISRVRTSRVFARRASKKSVKMLLPGPLFVVAWVAPAFYATRCCLEWCFAHDKVSSGNAGGRHSKRCFVGGCE